MLYPGCDKHVTASLCFENVVYVDFNTKLGPVFRDGEVLQWVEDHKDYGVASEITFLSKNFDKPFADIESFDLLISACAGLVSKNCSQYLKRGGHFLVSDAHSDARAAFVDGRRFKLVGVFDTSNGRLDTGQEALQGHFETIGGQTMTAEMVEESARVPRSKRSFKLKKEAMFYLFEKL